MRCRDVVRCLMVLTSALYSLHKQFALLPKASFYQIALVASAYPAKYEQGALVGTATSDFLVIGAGVIGVNLALEAKRRFPDARVTTIEKEAGYGEHASGRNSGVLHAGFYYTANSLKARLTRDGNQRLTNFCD